MNSKKMLTKVITEEEMKKVHKVCNECIDVFINNFNETDDGVLSVVVMKRLSEGFEKMMGMKLSEVIVKKKEVVNGVAG